ncbi:hypothetical protein V866_000051 [Kwoniella sp. B9012]
MGGVSSTLAHPEFEEGPARGTIISLSVSANKSCEKWTFTFSSDYREECQPQKEEDHIVYFVRHFDKENAKTSKEGIDYTQFFAPLRHWPLLRMRFYAWTQGWNHRRENHILGMQKKLQVDNDYLVGCEEANHEFGHMLKHEFNVEMRLWRRPNPDLPFPKREDNTFGYSWTAWKTAATYAGAKEPAFNLTYLAELIRDTLYRDLFLKYQSDDHALAADTKDWTRKQWIVPEDQSNNSCIADNRLRIASRMTDLLQSILTCQASLESIERLKDLGMLEGGKTAAAQAQVPGAIPEQYGTLHAFAESLMIKKQSEL